MSGRTVKAIVAVLIIAAAVSWDQGTKHAARAALQGKPPVLLVDRVLVLRYVENEGAFLSLGSALPRPIRTIAFIAFPLVVLGWMTAYFFRKGGISWGAVVGFSLIAGGGAGNLIDRCACPEPLSGIWAMPKIRSPLARRWRRLLAWLWRLHRRQLLLLGAGGSSMALTLYLHDRSKAGGDVPARIVVTALAESGLADIREVHDRIGFALPIDYAATPEPSAADRFLANLPEGSMVVNATGLGKDRPGSPLTDAAVFPRNGVAWEFNYRGDLDFLKRAKTAQAQAPLIVADGWTYFIHGWTRVIAEVFDIGISDFGPSFELLSQIALDATRGR